MPQGWRPTHPGDPTPGLSKAGRLVIVIAVAIGVAIALVIIAVRPAGASDGVASSANWQGPSLLPWFGGIAEMAQPGAQAFAGLATPTDACSIRALLVTDVLRVDVADSVFEAYVDDSAARDLGGPTASTFPTYR